MVILYAARHRLRAPRLARWMLALGVAASLAVNVAQGWSHGLVGAVVAAWPAVALVGSFELFAWMIRTAAGGKPDRAPLPDQGLPEASQPVTSPPTRAFLEPEAGRAAIPRQEARPVPECVPGPPPVARVLAQIPGPGLEGLGEPERAGQAVGPSGNLPGRASRGGRLGLVSAVASRGDIDAAAVAAYRASVQEGAPLSERKLAEAFGRTSRRWARNRIAEAWDSPVPG
jgi:hypothetical protein